MKKQRVCIMEHFNGNILIKLKGKYLSYTEVTQQDIKAIAKDQKAAQKMVQKARIYYAPPINHPWRRWSISNKGNPIYV